MFINKKTYADKSKPDTLKDLPQKLYFTSIFPQETYANGLLLEDLTTYISQKDKVYALRETPTPNYCDNLLANVGRGNSEAPTLNGFISSLSERNNKYSKKEIVQGITDLVKLEKIVIYPVIFSSLKNQKEELYGDFLLLANRQNKREYIVPFIKTAVYRNLRTLISWFKNGDTTKLLRSSDFSEDIFTGINKELKKLMYVTLIDPDNVASIQSLEHEISDYGTIDMISKYLTDHEILAKEQTIYLQGREDVKNRFDRRTLSDQEKYQLIKKDYIYFQSDTSPAKDLLREYKKLFSLLQYELLDRVSNELIMNQETTKQLSEFNDLRNDNKLKFPNLRYSELLTALIGKHLNKYKESYTFDNKKTLLYLEQGTSDDKLFSLYDIFLRIHKKALNLESFKFYDFNADELLRQVKENIVNGLLGEIYEDLQVKELIKNKEERLKTEFQEMYNQSLLEVIPFDYNNYLKSPSAKIKLINISDVKGIIKYQKYYEKNNYFLLPSSILKTAKETQNEDPWLIGNLIKAYNYTAKKEQPELKLKMLEDIGIRLTYNIFHKLNSLVFNEDKLLFETKVEALYQELKVSLGIYNKNPSYKNSKLLKRIEEIVEKKLESMISHQKELAKKEALFNFDPSKGLVGVLFGLALSLGLYLFIGGVSGIFIGLSSGTMLSYLLYRAFGRLFRKKIKTISEPIAFKEQRNGVERRSLSRNSSNIDNRRTTVIAKETNSKKENSKEITKEKQDELWEILGNNIRK